MDHERTTEKRLFIEMARDFPVRTGIFTFGPPVFALLQMVNGIVHEGALAYIGAFVVLAIACSVLLTRYHLAVYRRQRLVGPVVGRQ